MTTSTADYTHTFSNTDLTSYNFHGTNMRTLTAEDGTAWFVGKDATTILGYTNPSKALADHVDDEDKLNNKSLSSLGQRGGWLINESGLYSLILSSQLPTAKEFKHWVTSEVLPQIRRTGRYIPDRHPNIDPQLAQRLLDDNRRLLDAVVASNRLLAQVAAAQTATPTKAKVSANVALETTVNPDTCTLAERWYLAQIKHHGYAVAKECPFPDPAPAHKRMMQRFALVSKPKRIPRDGYTAKQTTRVIVPTSLTPTM